MAKIRVTKEFAFEAAHALWNYDGKCKNIHGHSYRLFITVAGEPIADDNNPKLGMVIDFGDLKRIVNKHIISVYDHALILNEKAPVDELLKNSQMFERKVVVNYQPTCENMVIGFADILSDKLPDNVELYGIKLYETATSYAEWYSKDN